MRKWDAESGKLIQEAQIHEDAIQDMQLSPDGSYVITASLDRTAQLVDITTLQSLKTYKTGRYVQSAAVSPLYDHVLLGGGQDAAQVGMLMRAPGGPGGGGCKPAVRACAAGWRPGCWTCCCRVWATVGSCVNACLYRWQQVQYKQRGGGGLRCGLGCGSTHNFEGKEQ